MNSKTNQQGSTTFRRKPFRRYDNWSLTTVIYPGLQVDFTISVLF